MEPPLARRRHDQPQNSIRRSVCIPPAVQINNKATKPSVSMPPNNDIQHLIESQKIKRNGKNVNDDKIHIPLFSMFLNF